MILLNKLDSHGIRGNTFKLLTSYLKNRKQTVRINSAYSSSRLINIGVPQGSILAPFLFLIYINDLPLACPELSTILFADDTTFCITGRNYTQLINVANIELQNFHKWTLANRLTINHDKSLILPVSNNNVDLTSTNLLLCNQQLQLSTHPKFLGVTLDANLNCGIHIKNICSKISKSIGIIFKLQSYLPVKSLINLYYTLVYPHLTYCTTIWGNTTTNHLNPLVTLQKRAIRIINKKPFLYHTNSLFFNNQILKIQDVYKFKVAVRLYKQNNFAPYQRDHPYHTRFRNNLRPDFQRLSITQRSIKFAGPSIFNEIPEYIKSSRSLPSFKKSLKKFYIDRYNQP